VFLFFLVKKDNECVLTQSSFYLFFYLSRLSKKVLYKFLPFWKEKFSRSISLYLAFFKTPRRRRRYFHARTNASVFF